MSQDPFTGAISLRPPTSLSNTAQLGPLVRAQPVHLPAAWASRFGLSLFGVGLANLLYQPRMGAYELAVAGTLLGVGRAISAGRSWWRGRRMRRCAPWDGQGPVPEGV